tara:strand:- start:456 stop:614 length:159 start_codon:yes stop_codon:yes gene_type:complete
MPEIEDFTETSPLVAEALAPLAIATEPPVRELEAPPLMFTTPPLVAPEPAVI